MKLFRKPYCFIFLHFAFMHLIIQQAAGNNWKEDKFKCPVKSNIIYPCICQKGGNDGLHISCENANLASLSIAFHNLGALDLPVEILIIKNGHFDRLFGPIFLNIKARQLYIEETPLQAVEDYTFYGLNNTLEELVILNSKLSSISPLSIGNLGKLIKLEVTGHLVTKLEKNLFTNQQISERLEIFRLVNGNLSEIPIETFQPLRKLKTLDLHGNQLETLQRNQFKNVRSVEVLDLSYNKIKKFEAQHISDLTKLGWCNISHNSLTELSRGTFARNSILKVLNMSHNNITRLDVNSFRGMRFLRRLFLNDNKISDIGRNTFGSIGKIGTIDLARNLLKKIDYQMFFQLNYVEIINVAENYISLVEKNSFKDIYQSVVNISHNMIEKIEPLAFENCVNITVLDLSFNRLQNFSRNAFDTTTFANELQLSHNMLTTLGQVPIQNMTSIRVLNVSYNDITEIPKNCFPKLYELHTIDVSHNNISVIANGVFQPLFSLRFLNLSYNSLEEIRSSVFGTLPTLLEMDLSHNKLISIVRGAMAKLTSMRILNLSNNNLDKIFQIPISLNELYLSYNNIQNIMPGTWPVMNSMLHLDLRNNQIADNLQSDSFKGLLVLQKILLNNNGITRVPASCLQDMPTLQFLNLEDNNITILDKNAFGKLPVLFEVNLSRNEIRNIEKRAFEGLLQLLTLNLSSNGLNFIPNEGFFGLPSLRVLDLSFNNLTKFDNKTHGVFDDLLSLESLNLSHNKLSFVTKKTFPSNQYIPYNLKHLDLSYNQMPVLTYDITFGTKKLRTLNLSNNQINEISRGILANFTSLEFLDLSDNRLTDLESEDGVFVLPQNLTQIILRNNSIYRLPFERFVNSSNIKYIDLRGNNLIKFPQTFVNLMQRNVTILFAMNPIECTCIARPLKHLMLQQSILTDDLNKILCNTPEQTHGIFLAKMKDENLQCFQDDNNKYDEEYYKELPDIYIRDVKIENDVNTTIRWFASFHKDIAGFLLYLRNKNNRLLFTEDLPYNSREYRITYQPIRKNLDMDTEICIVSKDSKENVGKWFSQQCQHFPFINKSGRATSNNKQHTTHCFQTLAFMLTIIGVTSF